MSCPLHRRRNKTTQPTRRLDHQLHIPMETVLDLEEDIVCLVSSWDEKTKCAQTIIAILSFIHYRSPVGAPLLLPRPHTTTIPSLAIPHPKQHEAALPKFLGFLGGSVPAAWLLNTHHPLPFPSSSFPWPSTCPYLHASLHSSATDTAATPTRTSAYVWTEEDIGGGGGNRTSFGSC
jgi:hypothetical protein